MLIDGDAAIGAASLQHCDVAIIGAGTMGLCLAAQLNKAGLRVVVLEAGGPSPNTSRNATTAGSVGHPHEGTDIGRATGLGGTSALWAGQLVEFDAPDLRRAGQTWPIDYDTLQAAYQNAYRVLGVGPRPSVEAYQEAMGTRLPADEAITPLITRWLPQPNFARLFSEDVDSDMPIVTGVEVEKIQFAGSNATHLTARTATGATLTLAARHFIMAASTVGNARLALAMQRQPGCPWRYNPFVGRYFQDHLGGAVGSVEVLDDTKFRKAFEHGKAFGQKFEPKLRFTDAVSAQEGVSVNGAFLFHSALHAHLSNLKKTVRAARNGVLHSEIRALPGDLARIGRSFVPLVKRYLVDHRVLGFYDQGVEFYVQAEQRPIAESRITLEDTQDGRLPKARVDWQIDGAEIETIRRFVAAADATLSSAGLARITPAPELGDDGSALTLLADTYHPAGGLKMSATADTGVTNAEGLIWNTQNVYVAGASILPSSSHANVTLTGAALTLRTGAHLIAKMKQTDSAAA